MEFCNKFVIPTAAYPNSCYVAQNRSTCAVFSKEDRMKSANATDLDRNSGERSGGTCFSLVKDLNGLLGRRDNRHTHDSTLHVVPRGVGGFAILSIELELNRGADDELRRLHLAA
jgi:hypothetical protein